MKLQKKRQILEIAEKLFNKFGIKKTGVEEIAKFAKVAKGTIYNYFGDKDGLFRELVKDKLQEFDDFIEKSFSRIKDPIGRLKITLVEYLKISNNNPFLSDELLYFQNEDKIRHFCTELNNRSKQIIDNIINGSYLKSLPVNQKKSIKNTLVFTLTGMNEAIKTQIGPVSLKQFETEIDFLIKAILPSQPIESIGG